MNFLLRLFTWWNGQTIGTQLFTWRNGIFVGEDLEGNKFYENKEVLVDGFVTMVNQKRHVSIPAGTGGYMVLLTQRP